MQTEKQLNELIAGFRKEDNICLDSQSGPITVMVIDRSFDVVTPLIHDFFYQGMLYDLLNVENDILEYEDKGSKKKAILSDNDDLLNRYKYKHIGEVLEQIPIEFK